ncbi:MAG TPA: hypothetical protein VI750_01775, partial [Pyrinomonadaceae bacterium]|nr:hypothetical protein [Pyrinomonadaceae bacterium]
MEGVTTPVLERPTPATATLPGAIGGEDEELVLNRCNDWVVKQGLPEGEVMYELLDSESGEPVAILDLAWPS